MAAVASSFVAPKSYAAAIRLFKAWSHCKYGYCTRVLHVYTKKARLLIRYITYVRPTIGSDLGRIGGDS